LFRIKIPLKSSTGEEHEKERTNGTSRFQGCRDPTLGPKQGGGEGKDEDVVSKTNAEMKRRLEG
jgi:hypothetical protein